jgi:hypothetical protein
MNIKFSDPETKEILQIHNTKGGGFNTSNFLIECLSALHRNDYPAACRNASEFSKQLSFGARCPKVTAKFTPSRAGIVAELVFEELISFHCPLCKTSLVSARNVVCFKCMDKLEDKP